MGNAVSDDSSSLFSFSGQCTQLGRLDNPLTPSFVADFAGKDYVALDAGGGRVVAVIGLTYDECRKFADAFAAMTPVRIDVRTEGET